MREISASGHFTLEVAEEVDSTSSELVRRACAGTHGNVALLARRQTAGRGRLGRHWQSFEGNLHLSVMLEFPDRQAAGHWSLMAAVALLDALRSMMPGQVAFRLKWPNDVLLQGRKLAGILLELVPAPDGDPRVIIGFGVNLVMAPGDLNRPVICLADIGFAPKVEAVAHAILECLSNWIVRYQVHGFGPIRMAWLAAGHRHGDPLTVTRGRTHLEGVFAGIADDGALLLWNGNREVKIAGGEVLDG